MPYRRRFLNARCSAFAISLSAAITPISLAAETGTPEAARELSGDVLQWAIPIAGLGLSWVFGGDDEEPSSAYSESRQNYIGAVGTGFNWIGPTLGKSPGKDFLIAFTRMELAVFGLKYSINAKRPNGGGQSFPSGHTASAFMGAEYIRQQHGWGWGIPAYVAAGWVGYTRVESNNHYWRDVAAGAAIGIASNFDFGSIETKAGNLSFGPSVSFGQSTQSGNLYLSPAEARSTDDEERSPYFGMRVKLEF